MSTPPKGIPALQGPEEVNLRLGLTLPSFRSEPGPVLAVAAAAEAAGVDGIFAFDHLFRARGDAPDAEPRPALELTTTLAAVAAETARITVGSLVARATLRPAATLVAALDTVARIAPGRLVAGLGSGDEESDAENHAFGVDTANRLERLEETVVRAVGRGYPVWVGGWAPAVRRLAATRADGWNGWGGSVEGFARRVAEVREEAERAGRDPAAVACTWGGLALLGADEAEAKAKLERLGGERPGLVWGGPERVAEAFAAYGQAGATWVIVGPLDSGDPDNARLLGQAVRPLLR
jgi:alkanesulfonate monooxygenase SsuD/methylene tetrahydromethanopterin reductase-like flavin-dependent oxidoreductase (luciferase family)